MNRSSSGRRCLSVVVGRVSQAPTHRSPVLRPNRAYVVPPSADGGESLMLRHRQETALAVSPAQWRAVRADSANVIMRANADGYEPLDSRGAALASGTPANRRAVLHANSTDAAEAAACAHVLLNQQKALPSSRKAQLCTIPTETEINRFPSGEIVSDGDVHNPAFQQTGAPSPVRIAQVSPPTLTSVNGPPSLGVWPGEPQQISAPLFRNPQA